MELALSLGDASKQPFPNFHEKPQKMVKDLGFCMGLGPALITERNLSQNIEAERKGENRVSLDPPLQLDLLPFSPVPRAQQPSNQKLRLPWITDSLMSEPDSSDHGPVKGVDVNRLPAAGAGAEEAADDGAAVSSPNSAVSSFQMEFSSFYRGRRKRDSFEQNEIGEAERASSRASDDEENALTRKKLRLSKEQSAFLEESFKEHHTLNPKQKLALAKQLNLRPRQVEVWFQNRRARTKLKQTEVDCEYLRRCCETLTEENRRLQKELQELRALKTSQPFYMQLPATTLTMCPSCERVASTTTTSPSAATGSGTPTATPTTASTASPATTPAQSATALSISSKPRFYPFSAGSQKKTHQAASAS